jgi:hypothetical protein
MTSARVLDTFTASLAQFSAVDENESQEGDITVNLKKTPKVGC